MNALRVYVESLDPKKQWVVTNVEVDWDFMRDTKLTLAVSGQYYSQPLQTFLNSFPPALVLELRRGEPVFVNKSCWEVTLQVPTKTLDDWIKKGLALLEEIAACKDAQSQKKST